MSDFYSRMHQNRFRLELRPRLRWGSLQRSLRLPSWNKEGLLLRKGEGFRGREERERKGGRGREVGRGAKGRWWKAKTRHTNLSLLSAHLAVCRCLNASLTVLYGVWSVVRSAAGIPLVYELNNELKPIKHYYTASDAEVKAAIDKVANQGKSKWIVEFHDSPLRSAFCILVHISSCRPTILLTFPYR